MSLEKGSKTRRQEDKGCGRADNAAGALVDLGLGRLGRLDGRDGGRVGLDDARAGQERGL